MTKEKETFHWGHESLRLDIVLDDDGSPRLTHLGPTGEARRVLLRITATGSGAP